MRIVATIVPNIQEALSYTGHPQTRAQELEVSREDALRIVNHPAWNSTVPVRIEHGLSGTVGRVVDRYITDDGKIMGVLEFDDAKASHFLGKLLVKEGVMNEVSLKHDRITGQPIEVSLVRKGARAGSVLHIGQEEGKSNDYMLVQREQMQNTTGNTAVNASTNGRWMDAAFQQGVPFLVIPAMQNGGTPQGNASSTNTQASQQTLTGTVPNALVPHQMTPQEMKDTDTRVDRMVGAGSQQQQQQSMQMPQGQQQQQSTSEAKNDGLQQQQQAQQKQQQQQQQAPTEKKQMSFQEVLNAFLHNESIPRDMRTAMSDNIEDLVRRLRSETDRANALQVDNEQTKIALAESVVPFIKNGLGDQNARVYYDSVRGANDLKSTVQVVAASANTMAETIRDLKHQLSRTDPDIAKRATILQGLLSGLETSQPSLGADPRQTARHIAASSVSAGIGLPQFQTPAAHPGYVTMPAGAMPYTFRNPFIAPSMPPPAPPNTVAASAGMHHHAPTAHRFNGLEDVYAENIKLYDTISTSKPDLREDPYSDSVVRGLGGTPYDA